MDANYKQIVEIVDISNDASNNKDLPSNIKINNQRNKMFVYLLTSKNIPSIPHL